MSETRRRVFLLGGAAALLPCLSIGRASAAEQLHIGAARGSIDFAIGDSKIFRTTGSFKEWQGLVLVDDADVARSTVQVNVNTNSIQMMDTQQSEMLKDADFFDVAKFPTLTFKSKRVAKAKEKGHLSLVGDLTIHGVTKEVTFDVTQPAPETKSPWGTVVTAVEAKTKINRKDFGLVWNKTLDGGGVLVSDEVNIDVNAELTKKAPLKAER